MLWWIFLFPFVSALTGFLVSIIAIKLFFYPSIFQKKQKVFAEKLATLIRNDFFSQHHFEQTIINPDNFKKLSPLIEAHMDEFLKVRLTKEMPYIAMFLGDKTIQTLKGIFMQELEVLFPEVMKAYTADLMSEYEPGKVISEKISVFPANKIKFLLENQMNDVKLFGTLLGFIVGLMQIVINLIFR